MSQNLLSQNLRFNLISLTINVHVSWRRCHGGNAKVTAGDSKGGYFMPLRYVFTKTKYAGNYVISSKCGLQDCVLNIAIF